MFAIGSNNNLNDLFNFIKSQNIPNTHKLHENIKYIDNGFLDNYRLQFSSLSYKRGSLGVANVIKSPGCKVYGGIFELCSSELISYRDILNVIRFKERYPHVYSEANSEIIANNKVYSCFFYYIDSLKLLKKPINNTIPILPLPCSKTYFNIIYESLVNIGIDNNILNRYKRMEKNINKFRDIIIGKFYNIINLYSTNRFDLFNYIYTNYKNKIYNSENRDDRGFLFAIIIICLQYVIKYCKKFKIEHEIHEIIVNNLCSLEYKLLIDLHKTIISFDKTIYNLQKF